MTEQTVTEWYERNQSAVPDMRPINDEIEAAKIQVLQNVNHNLTLQIRCHVATIQSLLETTTQAHKMEQVAQNTKVALEKRFMTMHQLLREKQQGMATVEHKMQEVMQVKSHLEAQLIDLQSQCAKLEDEKKLKGVTMQEMRWRETKFKEKIIHLEDLLEEKNTRSRSRKRKHTVETKEKEVETKKQRNLTSSSTVSIAPFERDLALIRWNDAPTIDISSITTLISYCLWMRDEPVHIRRWGLSIRSDIDNWKIYLAWNHLTAHEFKLEKRGTIQNPYFQRLPFSDHACDQGLRANQVCDAETMLLKIGRILDQCIQTARRIVFFRLVVHCRERKTHCHFSRCHAWTTRCVNRLPAFPNRESICKIRRDE